MRIARMAIPSIARPLLDKKKTVIIITVFQRVKKVLADFFARFKNAMFFVKLLFTKNLAVLVKKSDKSDVFDGYLSNSRRAAAPSSSPTRRFSLCIHF